MSPQNKARLAFLIIDPQNSFCHPSEGELFVPGADKDAERLSKLLERMSPAIDRIHVTLDTHHELDVAHPIFWVNNRGEHPAPFTTIGKKDVVNGEWKPYHPDLSSPPYGTLLDRMIEYVGRLEENGRYQLTVWPPHCRIGTPGHNVVKPVREALRAWELSHYVMVDYVIKGSNMFTEHYSGVLADVPDPADPDTHLNTALIQSLEQADRVVFCGEASSHCVANTVRDILRNFDAGSAHKCVLLEDAISPVPGFERFADEFFQEMGDKGVQIATTASFSDV